MGTFSKTFGVCLAQQGALLNSIPPILKDGNTLAWWDSSDSSTITKDENNYVSRWNDKLKSGNDLKQSNASSQPIINSNGVFFDGTNDTMKIDTTILNHPISIYIVSTMPSDIPTSGSQVMFDGYNNNSLAFFSRENGGQVYQKYGAYSGAFSPSELKYIVNKKSITRLIFNGANSKLQKNAENPITGDLGNNTSVNGISFGNRQNDSGDYCKLTFNEIIIRKCVDSEDNENVIYQYLAKKHLTIPYVYLSGDSTMAPYNSLNGISNYITKAGRLYDISLPSQTIAGQKFRWQTYGDGEVCDYVFVMVGINDLYRNIQQIITDYQDYIDTIRATIGVDNKIIAMTMIPGSASLHSYWSILNEAIKGNGATPITGIDGFIDTVNTSLNDGSNGLAAEYDSGDGLHENNDGRQLIASLIDAKIAELG